MSEAFTLLSHSVQRWIHRQGWNSLRPIQEAAIKPILKASDDVILAATTASGKTEAAFLPILSHLIDTEAEQETGCQVLYVAPLKALINDQFDRLDLMTESMSMLITPWHGDVSATKKKNFTKNPEGILLITPESIESLMVNHGTQLTRLFQGLQYVVIDELHSYIGTERGIQLQSLLHRLELVLRHRIPRIGLSATLGDMNLAAQYLRPEKQREVIVIESKDDTQTLRLGMLGYLSKPPNLDVLSKQVNSPKDEVPIEDDEQKIAEHLYSTLRGTHNLIFANSRRQVENYADLLRAMSEERRVPNEFLPHHGSLSKDLREFAEGEIKKSHRPMSIICTSTLEMGIDIGAVESIAQIGSPYEVASMRQRLGRSGRRDNPPTLRTYIQEDELTPMSAIQDQLRVHLVQATAMTQLLLEKWCEPPTMKGLHLSTLIQQILSIIAQHGGATAQQLWRALGVKGPFSHVPQDIFINLLHRMGEKQLLMQSVDGTLLHGKVGEQIVNHYTFYAAFSTPEEFTLLAEGKRLGSLPVDRPIQVNSYLIFGGRRWMVMGVDLEKKIIDLKAAKGGKAPKFGGTAGSMHDEIRQTMYRVYCETQQPSFLDKTALEFLTEGRDFFHRNKLEQQWILADGSDTHLFLWRGDVIHDTVVALLQGRGLRAENGGSVVTVIGGMPDAVMSALQDIVDNEPSSEAELASHVRNKFIGKYDNFLSPELIDINYASHRFDTVKTYQVLKDKMKND